MIQPEQTEHDHGTELSVFVSPDDQLDGAAAGRHRLGLCLEKVVQAFVDRVRGYYDVLLAHAPAHDLVIVPGPHDYAFNRGPGCAEMLLWQERALRSLPSP